MATGPSWSVVGAGGSHRIIGLGDPVVYMAGAVITAVSGACFAFATRQVLRTREVAERLRSGR